MMENGTIDQMEIDEAALHGAHRCRNQHRYGTPVVLPEDLPGESDDLTFRSIEKAFSSEELSVYLVELVKRSDALVRFLDNNVGESEDFPLCVFGEDEASVDFLIDQVDALRSAVGVILEL